MEYEVTLDDRGRTTALLIEAGEAATVAALRRALGTGTLHLDGEPLPDDRLLSDVPLVTGARLSAGRTIVAARPHAGREVAVVGGLTAGGSTPLPDGGTVTLGRMSRSGLVLDDPEVSRRHAEIRADGTGDVVVVDGGSRNGIGFRGYRIAGDTALGDGDVVRVGESVVAVRRCAPPDARLESDPAQGVRRFNRPPRIVPPRRRPDVAVPAPPDRPRGIRFPLATVLLPLLLAGVLFVVMPNSPYYLVFLVFSPVLAIAHVLTERRGGRKDYHDKLRGYEAELAAAQARLAALALVEEHASRDALPDPAALVSVASGPTGRLFERRPADDDFGRLRVGLTDRPADIHLTGPGELPTVYAVPVAVDLTTAGVVGVAGPRTVTLPIARALLVQAATLHAPHDLGLVLLTGSDEAVDWEWASWLPHTLPHRADLACRRMVATDREQAETRIAELRRILDERRADQRAGLRDQAPPGRRLLVVLDGARRLRNLPGLADVLVDGPGVGVYALCLDTAEGNLPDECRATVVPSGGRVRVSRPGADTEPDVLADGLPPRTAEWVARALAPIRVLGARFGDDGDLPERVRYLDLAGLGTHPVAGDVLARWASRPGGRSTEVLLGADENGPVTVDLRRDGPHALVAGTSGAGKSELLQTLVASLALGNAPDALNLVLVDYKGGSAFGECRDLPHCVGMVTDLDGHLANRALASLSAELRRRETLLAEAGAKDIEDYWAIAGSAIGGPRPGLARLVIVVDEFATLAEEVPDFVTGVVGIGMRGRSLGVHVVLATQRPAGVVSAEMRANVNLRLCLRVTKGEESSDVVEIPDAARISRHHPGRAYLRTGHSDLTILHCARIGWPRAAPGLSTVDELKVVQRRVTDLGRPRPVRTDAPDAGHAGDTDLTVLVTAIRAAAEQVRVAVPASPWLPPLPEHITVAELATTGGSPVAVPLGLADHPDDQAQAPFVVDLDQAAPVVIAGMARSGRTTALRTLAASLAAGASPADLHLYALDYGGRGLAPLAALPHVGAWVAGDEPDRAERLLDMLTAELDRRATELAADGYSSVREQRAAVPARARLPYMVLLVDRYETFLARHAEVDGGRLVDTLDGLLRRGPAVGILPLVATDRSGFTHHLGSAAATRLVLRQADPDDVAVFGVNPREVPRSMPDGRAVAVPAKVELQIALLVPDADGAAQAAAVDALAAMLHARWDGTDPASLPHRVDPLPATITAVELAALPAHPFAAPAAPTRCTVGAGGDHLGPVHIDLADTGPTFLVAGPPTSGRSTALAAIVASLAGRETGELTVLVCCPRPSPLTELTSLTAVAQTPDWTDLEDAIADYPGRVVVVVDDAELLGDGTAADVLERVVRTARDDGTLVIAAGTTEDLVLQRYRGWLAAMRRGRTGLLLNPLSYIDGEVFDIKLARSTSGGWPPGRALLVERGRTALVQVPLAERLPTALR